MLPIFAETSDGGVAVLTVLGTLVGGAAVWVAGQFFKWRDLRSADRDKKRKEDKEDEKTIVDHYVFLNQRMDRENAELRQEISGVRSDLTNTLAHVRYLEGIMESKQIPFRPFDLSQLGSSVHRALNADGTHDG
jgi:hypothetical protein